MALVKADHRLEQASFVFDSAGEVADVVVTTNYAVRDDVTGEEETRVRKTVSMWASLTATQKTAANAVGKRLRDLALGL